MISVRPSTRAEQCFCDFARSCCQQSGLLVALSGGADSVVLLHLAHRYAHLFEGKVEALHVHHGIRGVEADRDLHFCRELCARLGIPFSARRFDIPTLARTEGRGQEETARHYRYLALDDCAREHGLSAIATAHTATDNLETVLLQLTRGAARVIGIPPTRGKYIRPLLSASRQDILDYLALWQLPHVEDSTNAEDLYSRNLIRHQVLPTLEGLNPKVAEAFLRATNYSAEDSAYLDELSEQANAGGNVAALNRLPPPLKRRAVISHLRSLGFQELSSAHLEALLELVRKAHPHSSLSLPGGEVTIESGSLVRKVAEEFAPWEMPLRKGENLLPDGTMVYVTDECEEDLKKYISSPQNIYKLLTKATLGFAIIDGAIVARSKNAGDRILSGGMHRKVKKLFSEASLPLDQRNSTPLICRGNEIIWIPALSLQSDESKVSSAASPSTHLLWFIKEQRTKNEELQH